MSVTLTDEQIRHAIAYHREMAGTLTNAARILRENAEFLEGLVEAPPPDEPDPPVDPPPPPSEENVVTYFWRQPDHRKYLQGVLWKPIADGNRPLVVLLPQWFTVHKPAKVLADGEELEYSGVANGNRTHWRHRSKHGDQFQTPSDIMAYMPDDSRWVWDIPNPGKRTADPSDSGREDTIEEVRHYLHSAVTPPPDASGHILHAPSYWQESAAGFQGQIGAANYFVNGMGDVPNGSLMWKIPPWARGEQYSLSEQKEFIRRAIDEGFYGIAIDAENAFWYTPGYLREWSISLHNALVPFILAPKATLAELSGNPHVDVGRFDQDAHVRFFESLGPAGYVPWAYGSYHVHTAAHSALMRNGVAPERIVLLHDWFRENDRGYVGLHEWPKLVAWARQDPARRRLIGGFQPHSDHERDRPARMARELHALYS